MGGRVLILHKKEDSLQGPGFNVMCTHRDIHIYRARKRKPTQTKPATLEETISNDTLMIISNDY